MIDDPALLRRLVTGAVATLVLFVAVLAARGLARRWITRRSDLLTDTQRRLLVNVNNASFLLLLVGLFFIWAPELRTFALSITAFAVAFILATKELILCISGAVLRAATTPFQVGDWIDVGGNHGQVVDQNLFGVRLQEIATDGPAGFEYTGRTVVVPNSLFLSVPVRNDNFMKKYVFHSFALTLDPAVDPAPVERAVLDALAREMTPHQETAERYNALIERKAGVDIMGVEPRMRLTTTNEGRTKLTVTVFLPTSSAVAMEQAAIRDGLTIAREQVATAKAAERTKPEASGAAD